MIKVVMSQIKQSESVFVNLLNYKTNSMKKSSKINSRFSILIGAFLLAEGIWGLFSNVVFGTLTTNTLHASIHIILGITGIILGLRQTAREFCVFLGVLLMAVGLLRFVPGASELIIKILNVNAPVAYLNIVVGIASLIMASTTKKTDTIAV